MKRTKKSHGKALSSAQAAAAQGAPDFLIESLATNKIFAPRDSHVKSLSAAGEPWEARYATGRALRAHAPREAHASWAPDRDRPNPIKLIEASNRGRLKDLIPLRMQRMAETPFAFLRGAAVVMAWDLAHAPSTGLNVVIDGDCHINNFGLFGNPQGDIVVDLNDFDEVTIAPWEWDLKRLTASINLSGRDNGLSRTERKRGVMRCVEGYRWSLNRLQRMPVLDLWNRNTLVDEFDHLDVHVDKKSSAIIRKSIDKARASNNESLFKSVVERQTDGRLRIKLNPPVIGAIADAQKQLVAKALDDYIASLPPERGYMIRRYTIVDVVQRVVGVGSVGLRAFMILLMGNGTEDALFLQMKEAGTPAHASHLPILPEGYTHEGQRVVYGQRILQAAGDPLLGWTSMQNRPYYVRQMKNQKGAIPTEWLSGAPFDFFAWAYGALLARAHARAGDAAVISGYCGKGDVLDQSLAAWAEAYGDQTEIDHAAFADYVTR